MNSKEKAIELVNEYMSLSFGKPIFALTKSEAKKCALIAVEKILNNNTKIPANVNGLHTVENTYYWEEVKEEILKL